MKVSNENNIITKDTFLLLNIAWQLFRKHFKSIAIIGFISFFVSNLIIFLLPDIEIKGLFTFLVIDSGYLSFYLVVIFVITSIANIPIVIFTIDTINKKSTTTLGIFLIFAKLIKKNLFINISTLFVFILLFIIWIFLLKFTLFFIIISIPILIAYIYFSLTIYAFVVREINLKDSMILSYLITKKNLKTVLIALLISYIVAILVPITLSIPYIFFQRIMIAEIIFNTIVSIFCSYSIIFMTLIFINLNYLFDNEANHTRA